MSHRTRHVIDVGAGYATLTVHASPDFDYNLLCVRFEAACAAADAPKQPETPKAPERKTVVIAGTYHQFSEYCRQRHLNPRRTVYAGQNDELLRGLDPKRTDIIFTGTYWDSPTRNSDHLTWLLQSGATLNLEDIYDMPDAPKQDEAPKPTVHEHDWVLTGVIEAHRPDDTIHALLSCKCGALHWEPTHNQVHWPSMPIEAGMWRGEGYMAPASRYVNWRMPSEAVPDGDR